LPSASCRAVRRAFDAPHTHCGQRCDGLGDPANTPGRRAFTVQPDLPATEPDGQQGIARPIAVAADEAWSWWRRYRIAIQTLGDAMLEGALLRDTVLQHVRPG